MVNQNDSEHLTLDIKHSSWRKSSTLTATWHDAGELKLHMPFVSRSAKSRFGFRTGVWSGKKNTKWLRWMACQCIKCIQHSPMAITCMLWVCINSVNSLINLAQPECSMPLSKQKRKKENSTFIENTIDNKRFKDRQVKLSQPILKTYENSDQLCKLIFL